MLIGLMSDTHDNLPMVDRAVRKLGEHRVELVLHAGDYVAGFVVPKLKDVKCRFIGVFGNNDGDHELLKNRFSEYSNMEIRDVFATIPIGRTKIALLHGSNKELLDAVTKGGNFDFVVHGHSHTSEIRKEGKTLIVNPGEVCGYLTGKSTICLLETNTRQAKIIDI